MDHTENQNQADVTESEAPAAHDAEVEKRSEQNGETEEHNGESHHSHHSHHSSHSHHSHHSRHRRGRHRHRSSSGKKENNLLNFLKKYRGKIINITACVVCVVLLILLAIQRDIIKDAKEGGNLTGITDSSVIIESAVYTNEVSLVHEAISEYLRSDPSVTANSVYKRYEGFKQKLNIAIPVTYTYDIDGLPLNETVSRLWLEISRYEDLSNAKEYDLDPNSTKIELYHLYPGETYYYRLNLTLSGGATVKTVGEFTTAMSPRILTVDNVANVRDIGGWMTDSGARIRYGLLYRGRELDGAVEADSRLTEDGRSMMLTDLGIRFDMDLRSESVNPVPTDALGRFVTHRYYGISMYSGIFEDGETEKLRAIFSDLADKQNYPMYMHCTYGRDRTGTVCYLLEALLGVSEEDLRREYELSAFTDSYVDSENFAVFLADLRRMEGNTMKDKVEGYLLSIGVTAEEIASIRAIFLGTES